MLHYYSSSFRLSASTQFAGQTGRLSLQELTYALFYVLLYYGRLWFCNI